MEAVFWKSLSMMVMNYCFAKSYGSHVLNIPRKFHKIMLLRAFAGFGGVSGLFTAAKYIPMSLLTCILMTNPLFVSLLGYVILREKLSKTDYLAIVFAFFGIILINDPFGWVDQDTVEVKKKDNKLLGVMLTIMTSFSGAVAFICMRYMKTDIHFSIGPFWYSTGCTFFSGVFLIFILRIDLNDSQSKFNSTDEDDPYKVNKYIPMHALLLSIASVATFVA